MLNSMVYSCNWTRFYWGC